LQKLAQLVIRLAANMHFLMRSLVFSLVFSLVPAFAVDTTFGEILEPATDIGAQEWWKKDHEARQLLKDGKINQAKTAFEAAVKIAEKNSNMDPGLVNSLVGLALLEHKSGHAFESERLYELAMRYEEGFAGPGSEKFAAFLPDLAWLYQWHGNTTQAELLYKRAIATISSKNPEDDPKLCQFLTHYKAFLTQCGRTSEAEKIAVQLRRIDSKIRTVR